MSRPIAAVGEDIADESEPGTREDGSHFERNLSTPKLEHWWCPHWWSIDRKMKEQVIRSSGPGRDVHDLVRLNEAQSSCVAVHCVGLQCLGAGRQLLYLQVHMHTHTYMHTYTHRTRMQTRTKKRN